jgi:hypothetical protein
VTLLADEGEHVDARELVRARSQERLERAHDIRAFL